VILISWTLAGPGTAPIIGDALRSVAPIVDACMVIWTGYETQPIGWAPDAVGEPGPGRRTVYARAWPWRDDYGAARNAALDFAEDTGADWSVMVDTDERVICPDPAALRAWLAALPASIAVVCVHHNDGSHTRERFFRMPSRYRFQGKTHEAYPCPENEQAIAPREMIQWSELPKTRAQLRAKFIRDVGMLREDIAANPKNGAAYYYLGTSLQTLAVYAREDAARSPSAVPGCGRCEQLGSVCEFHGAVEGEWVWRDMFTEAIAAFREHMRIDTAGAPAWHEGTAFSCYRAAECYLALGEPNRVLDCAAAGLILDAGIGELYWIAAVASLQEGRLEQARAWAESAKAHAMGSASERRRRGFRVVRGLTTGPDEVLAAVEASRVTPLESAWERVFATFDLNGKPRSESPLGLARDDHPNALAIVRNELDGMDCMSCGPLENCPGAKPGDLAKREALRDLLRAMGEP
jgi:hypothetical protein